MNPVRGNYKTTLLVLSLGESFVRYWMLRARLRLFNRRTPTASERAVWLHGCCRRIVPRLGLKLTVSGQMPERGLIVSNHLGYFDVLLYGSIGPVIFVSKDDVRSWPLLGKFAEYGGTVFVDRARPAQAIGAAEEIAACLDGPVPVLLFPEGTSTDGTEVLPFRPPLLEPAVRAGAPVTAAAIAYAADGAEQATLCYFGDKVFLPHLHATLGYPGLAGSIRFSASEVFANRKDAARATRETVCAMLSGG